MIHSPEAHGFVTVTSESYGVCAAFPSGSTQRNAALDGGTPVIAPNLSSKGAAEATLKKNGVVVAQMACKLSAGFSDTDVTAWVAAIAAGVANDAFECSLTIGGKLQDLSVADGYTAVKLTGNGGYQAQTNWLNGENSTTWNCGPSDLNSKFSIVAVD